MQLTGHKTRSVFERYNIGSSGDLQAAARGLDTPTTPLLIRGASMIGAMTGTIPGTIGENVDRRLLPRQRHNWRFSLVFWRRERDSNPRYPSGYSGFQDHRHRPLGHPSASNLRRNPCDLTARRSERARVSP